MKQVQRNVSKLMHIAQIRRLEFVHKANGQCFTKGIEYWLRNKKGGIPL